MSLTNKSMTSGSGVLCIIGDHFDVMELKKSILKTAEYEILLSSTRAALDMAERHFDGPAARRARQIIDPQTHCNCARELSRMRDT